MILSALEVFSRLPYVNDDIANRTVYSIITKRISLKNVLLPFNPFNFRGFRKLLERQTRQLGDVYRINDVTTGRRKKGMWALIASSRSVYQPGSLPCSALATQAGFSHDVLYKI